MLKKRLLSALLSLCMVAGMLPVMTTTARATSKTADDAIAWASSQVNHSVGRDDGSGYYQCVEFIRAYYQWLGVGAVSGDGAHYATNYLPSGWTRTAGGTPQKGDILVYLGNPGHVAIYESDNALYDQDGNVKGATVKKESKYYRTYIPNYWGCIHPNFASAQPAHYADTQDLGDDFYAYIYNQMSNCNLENRNDNVQLASVNGSDFRQIWHFIKQGQGQYKIVNMFDGRCLDAENLGTTNYTNVHMCEDNGSDAQRWFFCADYKYGPYYVFPSYLANHDLVLDVADLGTTPGTNIHLIQNRYKETGAFHPAQTFQVNKIDNIGKISIGNDFYAYMNHSFSGLNVGNVDGNAELVAAEQYEPKQIWHFTWDSTSYVSSVILPDGEYRLILRAINTKYENLLSDAQPYDFTVSPELETYTVSVNATAGGTVTGGGTYPDGTNVTVSATASEGYNFKGWSENGTIVSTNASYTFEAKSDRTLTATFEKKQPPAPVTHTVNVSAEPAAGGTVTGNGTYQDGESVTVTATVNTGYTFKHWTENGNEVSTSATYTFTATTDRTLVAVFEKEPDEPDPPTPVTTYTVNVNASPAAGGTVSGGGTYQSGASATIRAVANSGYTFKGWTKGSTQVSTDAVYTFSVAEDTSLTAVFEADAPAPTPTYRIDVDALTGGTVSGGGTFQRGASVTVTATPNSGYRFVEWREDGKSVSADATYIFSVSADRTLTAVFDRIEQPPTPSYTVSVSADPAEGGSVSGGGAYQRGASATVTATANNDYHFACWMNGDERVSTSPSYTFGVSRNISLVAVFEENPPAPPTSYMIAVQAAPAEGGTVTGGGTYQHGTPVTITAAPSDGYRFVEWRLNGTQTVTSASYSFTAIADQTYIAVFEEEEQPPTPPTPVSYTISVSASPAAGGSVSGGGTYQENTPVTVNANANEGYTFKQWTEDGSEVSTDASYTFIAAKNQALVAVFEKKKEEQPPTPPTPVSYTISVSASPAAGGTVSGGSSYQSGASATVTAIPSRDYRFTGWTENGSLVSTSTSYTFTVISDRMLVAGFAYVGSSSTTPGGNPSGSTNRPSTGNTTTTTPLLPVNTNGTGSSGMTTTASPDATIRGDVATSIISSAIAQEIIKQAVANDSGKVVIAPMVKTDVTKAEITLPATVLKEIEQKTSAGLIISTPHANVSFQNNGLSALSNRQDVVVSTEQTGNALELSITVGGQLVERVPGGLTLTAPVSQSTPGIVAVVVHEDGTRQVVRKSVVAEDTITIPLDGSATLEIIDNAKSFADVNADSWAADAVAFASAHELFSGTSTDRFSPDLPMTRGMLAKVLHNLENNPSQSFTSTFSDVSTDAWYSEAVAWAAERGIVSGYGNGLFGPSDNITREQLAVMLWRYVGEPAATNKELHFNDVDEVSGYALDALYWATENGIINGKGGGILDPRGQATRAQVAQMLMNYMRK